VGIQKVVLIPKHSKIRHVDTEMVVYFIIPWYYNGVHIRFRVSIYIYIYIYEGFLILQIKSSQVKYHKIFLPKPTITKTKQSKLNIVLECLLHPF
jgi:hypothetical protein